MGRVANNFVKAVNQATSEEEAVKATFRYLNKKVPWNSDYGSTYERLSQKLSAAQQGMVQYQGATQAAFNQFLQAPDRLGWCDSHALRRMDNADYTDVPRLVDNFVYGKLYTSRSIAENQIEMQHWAAVADGRLTSNRGAAAAAFGAACDFNYLDDVKTRKAAAQRRQARHQGFNMGFLMAH